MVPIVTVHRCGHSALLYSLLTSDYVAQSDSNQIRTFADDITNIGLITSSDETAYRQEVSNKVVQ